MVLLPVCTYVYLFVLYPCAPYASPPPSVALPCCGPGIGVPLPSLLLPPLAVRRFEAPCALSCKCIRVTASGCSAVQLHLQHD